MLRPTRASHLGSCESLRSQLLDCCRSLLQVLEAHPADHRGCLGELDVPVVDYLNLIAPGIEEVEAPAREDRDLLPFQGGAGRGLVVDDEAEVPGLIGRLAASLAEREELITHVDECHSRLPLDAAQLKESAVELQRGVELSDLERDMVDPH